jgi:putative transposase
MSIEGMCGLAKLSRAGYYRFLTTPQAGDADMDLRDAIQRIALEFPSYGRPRITAAAGRWGMKRRTGACARTIYCA